MSNQGFFREGDIVVGIQGPPGPRGIPGTVWYSGTGLPDNDTGVNGDFYLQVVNGSIFEKNNDVYTQIGSFAGPYGPQGPQGTQGVQGIQGVTGLQGIQGLTGQSYVPSFVGPTAGKAVHDADVAGTSYLDTTLGKLYWKLTNTSGDWSAGVNFTTGPQGVQGVQGVVGPQGVQGATGQEGPAGPDGIIPVGIMIASNNLSDLANVTAAQGNLDLRPDVDILTFRDTLFSLGHLSAQADKIAYFDSTETMALTDFSPQARVFTSAVDTAGEQAAIGLQPGVTVQAFSAKLTSLAGLAASANKLLYFSDPSTFALVNFQAFGRLLVAATDAPAARSVLGLVINSQVQGYSSILKAISELTTAGDKLMYFTGPSAAGLTDFPAVARTLLAAATQAAQQAAMGLGTAATKDVGVTAGQVVMLDTGAKLPAVDGSQLTNLAVSAASLPGYISGMEVVWQSTTSFFVKPGTTRNEDAGSPYSMALAANRSKTLSSFVAGNANGGLDTGFVAANTWYHVHVIRKDSDGTIDVLYSLSPTGPSMPAGYTARRRVGSFKTDGSSQITKFHQKGDRVYWDNATVDFNAVSAVTTSVNRTLSVPPGIQVIAIVALSTTTVAGGIYVAVTPTDVVDAAASATNFALACTDTATDNANVVMQVVTNTSGQIRTRHTDVTSTFVVNTLGWIDSRGKDG